LWRLGRGRGEGRALEPRRLVAAAPVCGKGLSCRGRARVARQGGRRKARPWASDEGPVARQDKAIDLIRLVLHFQGSGSGLSLADVQARFGVSRRTAERMRDAVQVLYPELEEIVLEDGSKRWRLPARRAACLIRWTSEEIAVLETEARFADEAGRGLHGRLLREVATKIRASLERREVLRLDPDVEALAEAEGLAMRPGPNVRLQQGVFETLRQAILACRTVRLDYRRSRTREQVRRFLHPYGFLYGNRQYVVGYDPRSREIRLLRLSGIRSVELLDEWFERPPDFDLGRFAERSFGVFQEPPYDVVWRFDAEVASSAQEYVFHPSQRSEMQPDGSLLVRFRAGGLQEMAFHAFTWQGHLEVLAPKELRALLRELAETVAASHGS